jgi:serine/threonine protein kinase
LNYPGTVKVLSYGKSSAGKQFLVMEFLEGSTLAETYLQAAMPPPLFFDLFIQIVDAIRYLHSNGLVHANLAPENIMICETALGTLSTKLFSFGPIRSTLQSSRQAEFMSPEECKGEKAEKSSDIYSLGAMMFQCLSNRPLFSGSGSTEIYKKQIEEAPPILDPSLFGARLSMLIGRCLDKEAKNRPNADELSKELKQIKSEFSSLAAGIDLSEPSPPRKRNANKRLQLLLATFLLLSIFGGSQLIRQRSAKNAEYAPINASLSLSSVQREQRQRQKEIDRLRKQLNRQLDSESRKIHYEELHTKLIQEAEFLMDRKRENGIDAAMKDYREALVCCDQFDRQHKSDGRARANLGIARLLALRKQRNEALEKFNEAINESKIWSTKSDALAGKTVLEIEMGKFRESDADVQKLLDLWSSLHELPESSGSGRQDSETNTKALSFLPELDNRWRENSNDEKRLQLLRMTNKMLTYMLQHGSRKLKDALNKQQDLIAIIEPGKCKNFAAVASQSFELASKIAQANGDSNNAKLYLETAARYKQQINQ